jgi:hypothetical protein
MPFKVVPRTHYVLGIVVSCGSIRYQQYLSIVVPCGSIRYQQYLSIVVPCGSIRYQQYLSIVVPCGSIRIVGVSSSRLRRFGHGGMEGIEGDRRESGRNV